ncbi:MAG: tetratricopeptide repeat protein [Deltaproteobacteria bacterium]|nr:tetratricopeptide repeat protein [Deltaproteobacteria bacterium]
MSDGIPVSSETVFVGRRQELAQLEEELDNAIAKELPTTTLVVGEQGTGKTHLVRHFCSAFATPRARVLRAVARPDDGEYGVFRRLLARRFGSEGKSEDLLERLRSEVEEVMGDRRIAEIIHFLGVFVDVEVRGSPLIQTLEDRPVEHDLLARTVLRRFLELDAKRQPLVLVVDDLHHADDCSLRLFGELVCGVTSGALQVIGVGRPELLTKHQWVREEQERGHLLEIGSLHIDDVKALINAWSGGGASISVGVAERACEITGGNPLFLRGLVSAWISSKVIDASERVWVIDEERALGAEVPLSMEEAVGARMGMLDPAERALLERAAVVGPVFWPGCLITLTRLEQSVEDRARVWTQDTAEAEVAELLVALTKRGVLEQMDSSTVPSEMEYGFGHELEREFFTARLDERRRERYHLVVGQWLEERIKSREEGLLVLLARHYEKGGERRRAGHFFLNAGDQARARFANHQAVAFYERGLSLLGIGDLLVQLNALHNLGDVSVILGQYSAAQAHFAKMLELSWLLDKRAKGGAAHRRLGRLHRILGVYESATVHLKMALRLFQQAEDKRGVAATLDDLGQVLTDAGNYQEAVAYHEKALSLKREIGDARSIAVSLHNLGVARQERGSLDAAGESFQSALEMRRDVGDRLGVADTLDRLGMVARTRSEYNTAIELWKEALLEVRQVGDHSLGARIMLRVGEARLQLGDVEQASAEIKQAAALARERGDQILRAETLRVLALLELERGDVAAASRRARAAQKVVEGLRLRPQRALVLRSLAETLGARELNESQRAQVQAFFEQSKAIFEEIGNKLELARTCAAFADFSEKGGDLVAAKALRARGETLLRDAGVTSAEDEEE